MKVQLLFAAMLGLFSVLAQAELKDQFNVSSVREDKLLKIQLVETESRGTMCDLVVTRFEYFADLSLMNIETKESDFCPTDVFGARKALVLWQIPQLLRKGGKLSLRVNGKLSSTITWTQEK